MSIAKTAPKRKSAPKAKPKPKRFNRATRRERKAEMSPPRLVPDQQVMRELLPDEVLTRLARSRNAGDVRQRALTCTMFFWVCILAFGPGGPISLHKVMTYLVVASVMSGLGAAHARVSKEALSENFRERPWQFFEAVVQYLLMAYAALWSQVASQPNMQVVRDLHIELIDATVMRVAHRLIDVFPANRNGKCKEWAAVKLHTRFSLFRGVPEVLALTPQKKHERKVNFLRPMGEAVLYIFDLGYWTYALFDDILDRQQHFISRLKGNCNPLILEVYVGKPEWVGQRLKDIRLVGQTLDCLVNLSSANPSNPQMRHTVRLVGQWITKDKEWHLYITSFLDRQRYSLALIIDLYRLRWQIEILFRTLKHVLRMANFVSITENGIRIQIYAALIHYLLTHLLILKAAHETGRPVEDFSIPYCLDAVQQVLQQSQDIVLKGETPDWGKLEPLMLELIMTIGLRPNQTRKPLMEKVKRRLRRTDPLPV